MSSFIELAREKMTDKKGIAIQKFGKRIAGRAVLIDAQETPRVRVKDKYRKIPKLSPERVKQLNEWGEYLISKGWQKGTYEYPEVPGGFIYKISHPEGGNEVIRTLCQAMKFKAKLDRENK